QFIPIIERTTAEMLPVAEAGWGDRAKGRPLYVQQGNVVTGRSVGAEQYGRFMIDVFEEWVRADVGTVYVQLFDTTLANWVGEPGLHYLCPSYKTFFHHVAGPMRLMAELLARDRPPAEIMAVYATADGARGRNDPCTCGRARKWKHCHGL